MAVATDFDVVLAARQHFSSWLFGFAGVHGVGAGSKLRGGKRQRIPAIRVYVEKKLSRSRLPARQLIPPRLPAFDRLGRPIPNLEVATDVERGGPYRLASPVNTDRCRPLIPGFGTGLILDGVSPVGTIGAALIDRTGLRRGGAGGSGRRDEVPSVGEAAERAALFFLTCAHVVVPADPQQGLVIQPAKIDGGTRDDSVGTAERWTPWPQIQIRAPGLTTDATWVDAAAVRIDSLDGITADIQDIGPPTGEQHLIWTDEGARLRKAGRTTGVTSGVLVDSMFDAALSRAPGTPRGLDIMYRDQMLVRGEGVIADRGDSGALVVDEDGRAVGLLVGADEHGSAMIVTKIVLVLHDLNHPRLSTGRRRRTPPDFILATRN